MRKVDSANSQQGGVTLYSIKNKKTIGIPRALSFYEDGEVWEIFFKQLGFDVVFSVKTNIETLNKGVIYCTNDTCLPVKVFHGHILDLKDKADFIFVPRYISTAIKEYSCPKLCGLPDMVSYNLKNDLNIFEIKINANYKKETYDSLKNASRLLGLNYLKVLRVFEKTIGEHLKKGEEIKPVPQNKKKISVLGHPYMIYDEYLSMNLIDKLTKEGYYACTPLNVGSELSRGNAYPYNDGKKEFYSVGLDNLGSFNTFLDYSDLCGIIFLTPFACGVDSLVVEFIERGLNGRSHIPFMKLTVDEHTGEAGFDTRLEAFLDMI